MSGNIQVLSFSYSSSPGAEDCYIVDGNFGTEKTESRPPSAPKINKIYADAGPFPADINAVVYCNSNSTPEQVAKFFDRCISQLPGLSIFVYASSIYVNWGAGGRSGGEDTSMDDTPWGCSITAKRVLLIGVRASADCGTSEGLIDGGEADWKLTEEMAEQDYCCEQALARRWLQNERSCRLAFVRLGLLTPPACSTLSRAFSAVAERVMVPEARALARARVGKSASDLMTISLLPTLDGRKTDPKAVILITPADLAARAVLSAAVEGVRGSAEITESPQVYALALASPMLQWDKLRCLIIDHSGGRVSAADGRGTGAVLRRAPPPHEVCSATLERIDPEVCADVRGLHIHNYLTHCLGLIENGGAEFLDVRPPTGRSLTMQQPLRYTDVLSDAKWQHGGVLNFALRKEALSYYMPSMERVRSLVMNSRAVREATHSKKLKGEAEAMLGFVIVLHRVFTSIYDRVLVNHDGLGKLKELNQRGAKILLLPTHRSYIDFLVLSYICYYADIRLPFIATGDNFFSIAGIWKILQHSGAFFMKRSFNSETHPLYSIVFKTYMQVILDEQGCVEMFIEGARSRSGTMIRPPKVGLLRFATEPAVQTAMNASSASDFTDEDEVFLVPISIGYSRVMEVDSLATELEGRAKVAESLARTVSALRYLSMNFGTLTVHIDPEPIKVSDVVKRWMSEQKGDYSPSPVPPKSPRYATPYQQLAEEVADRLDANMPIHTTHLMRARRRVAAILLWKRHDSSSAVSHAMMVDKVRWLSSLLRRRGLTVILDDNNTSSAVSRVASLYVDHVVISAPEEETGEVKYSVCPANPLFATLLLSYYRNQLIYHLGHEACLVLAAGDLTKLSFLRTEILLECIPAQQQQVPEGCDRELNDFAVSLIGPGGRVLVGGGLGSLASGLAKEMYEEGRCSYLEACSFDFAKKAVRGMEKRGCITVKGRTVHITVEKMHELLALLESIKESPALPQGKALSNSSEVSCGGVEERQQPAQRGLFTQLRDMTLVKPLGRLNGTSRM
ncbi:hypothetical protein FOZ60_006511 [Perkinsus olseni]|uniref:Phospholipid/glycerol acyltransferase domain-containing protein n=1 Tax=Perkinsus olseni TaxID=32597 RepID=A0A7J6NNQ8_PEROL|nr:hypothetical protein FOZ60_006511 [Perkinsus olseni]